MRRIALSALAAVLLAAPTAAQERVCNVVESGRTEGYGTGETATVVLHDPFVVRCTDGAELRARSGTVYVARRELHLVGDVFFQDADRTLTSEEATYASQLGRLWARDNVVFVDRAEGSTLQGPELEYFRVTEQRPVSEVIAVGRPHLTLRSEDAEGDEEPLELDADRVVIVGEDQLQASGSVVIRRTDLHATGSDASYDAATDALEIRGDAVITSEEYRLAGETVRARLPEGGLEYVSADADARLTGQDLTLTAPSIQLFFADDRLQRSVATGEGAVAGAGRAVALAEGFRLEADSLDIRLPGQRLEQVVAVGEAVGERFDTAAVAAGDSSAIGADRVPLALRTGAALAEYDWIRGDTITGAFEPADTLASPDPAAADSSVVLRTLVARGAAQSLYRIERTEEEQRTAAGRSINFLSGETISLRLTDGEVDQAEVRGVRRGLYLEPAPPEETAPPGGGAPAAPFPPGPGPLGVGGAG